MSGSHSYHNSTTILDKHYAKFWDVPADKFYPTNSYHYPRSAPSIGFPNKWSFVARHTPQCAVSNLSLSTNAEVYFYLNTLTGFQEKIQA